MDGEARKVGQPLEAGLALAPVTLLSLIMVRIPGDQNSLKWRSTGNI